MIAPPRADRITRLSTMSIWTIPLPIVCATAVPTKNTAAKVKKAAQMTAYFGERTRVETTVEIELAESWKPLRKSKTSATIIRKTTKAIESSMFQDNPFHNVGYIFTNINCFFKELKNIFPFYKFDRVFFVFEKVGHDSSQNNIAGIFQRVNFHATSQNHFGV